MFSDAHCDTMSEILDRGESLRANGRHLDLARLEKYGGGIQFYAAFIDPKYEPFMALPRCMNIIDKFDQETEENGLQVILAPEDVDKVEQTGMHGALLSIEGGSAIAGRLSNLRLMHRLGVRAMTLTWNGRNEIADGIGQGENAGGLTPFGRDTVLEMNRLGMLVDVSHLSVKGFWDVAEVSQKPFIASHSNAISQCSFRRNLADDQIRVIVERNGFIGINLCPEFLMDGGGATVDDAVRHIEYFMELGAQDVLGFGADFDGIDSLPDGMHGVEDMGMIVEALLKRNYSQALIDKLMYKNLHRCLKENLKK